MVVAVRKGFDYAGAVRQGARLRVATKYVNTTRQHFAAKGVHVDLIRLYGSMELAPLTGLADAIVDLVATGKTLKANDLVAVEEIMPVSARLIVNQAALKTRRAELQPLIDAFAKAVAAVKLRRLSTRAAGFDRKLAALTRYDAAQDPAGAEGRAQDPRRRAHARRRGGARIHEEIRRGIAQGISRFRKIPRCHPARSGRGVARGAPEDQGVPREAAAEIVGLHRRRRHAPRPAGERRSSASGSTCPAARRPTRRRC